MKTTDETYLKLQAKREFNVRKSNALIQKSRFELSLQEQKVILSLIQMIKPNDEELKLYDFKIKDFCELCGIDKEAGKNYKNIRDTLKKLSDKSYWITLEDGRTTLVRWIERPFIDEKGGNIHIKLDILMKPFLLQIKKNFTQYSLYYVLAMKSQYSIRIYELLKSYLNLRSYESDINELKKMLQCQHYGKISDFKSRVLDQAMREINQFTDLNVSYELIKDGRMFSKIIFKIERKKEMFDTWENIDRELSSKHIDGQLSFLYNNEIDG